MQVGNTRNLTQTSIAGGLTAALLSYSPHIRLRLAILLLLLVPGILHAQISPGPLARAHQSLNGDTNCVRCHAISTHSPQFRCVDCHREIAAELQQNKGLHATFPRSSEQGAACVKCHSDHNGADFQMIRWNPTPQGFDHSKTGFTLDGHHAQVACRTCHTAAHIPASARTLLASKDLNRTWMGLSTSCVDCHEDKHQGRFGANCSRCHSTTDWKAASFDAKSFDHSTTRFPLTGEHRYVRCQDCHTNGPDGQPRYEGIKFQYCADCHRDPHKGEFTQTCDTCHTTSTWKKSDFASKFDHSKTGFPLLGKHLEVACLDCHRSGDFKAPMPHAQCSDCHQPDPHNGQFTHRPDGGKCESCHTVQGWSPSTFTVAQHAKTRFPIVFPHQNVPCSGCHAPAGKNTRFQLNFARCTDCHEDVHRGQFAAAPWLNRCERCHQGATFKTSNYTIDQHQTTRFPLSGGHLAVPCNECHKPLESTKVIPFHFAGLACTSCHEDIHHGQFARRMAAQDHAGKPLGCLACHSTTSWSELSKFDHDATSFSLTGSHRATECSACHRPPNLERTMLHVEFTKTPVHCGDCHENPHSDQFGAKASQCESCHNTNKWRPSLFDHEQTGFPLKGGHENVPCASCHTNHRLAQGTMVLFYKPTPKNCEACHGSSIPQQHPAV